MKIVFAFFLFSFLLLDSKAQQELTCGVTSESWKQERLNFQSQQAAANNQRITATTDTKYIPLTIHFVRHTNGTYSKNTSMDLFYKTLVSMNKTLAPINIQFYVDGNIHYINNDAYLKPLRGSAEHTALLSNKNANTANIWINDGWAGTAAIGLGTSQGVELAELSFITVMHEFGHFFSLAHTFDISYGIEHIARTGPNSNCIDAGDGLCDTEADPYGLTVASNQIIGANPVVSNCSLTSNTKDLTGATYTPPLTNIMAYYFNRCGAVFTPNQFNVMTVSYSLFHAGYTTMTGSGIAAAPTNLTITNFNGYDVVNWANAASSVGTQIETSVDNGTTWKIISGELSGITSTILHDIKQGSSYLIRLRHINSLVYSSTLSYSPEMSNALNPIQIEHPENTVYPAIQGLKIATLDRTSTNNQFYSLHSPSTVVTLSRGGTYPTVLSINPTGLGTYVAVWLDENRDGIFNNTNELKYQYASSSFVFSANFNVAISETCDTGFVRMRVRIFTEMPSLNASGIMNDSETEDYIFKIINAEQQDLPYCSALTTGGCTSGSYGIASFNISSASFTNTSVGCGVTTDGYSDYSSKTINLTAGQTYAFTETNGTGWGQSKYLSIYLDANQNAVFDSNELVYSHGPKTAVDPATGSFNIPSNAINGTTRLRIRAYQNPILDGCANAYYGESEDYSVNITGGKEARVTNMSVTNITANSMLIGWQKGASNTPTGYTIKISTDGQTFSLLANVAGSATSYPASNLQPNTRYYFQMVSTGPINSDPKIVYASTNSSTTPTLQAISNTEMLKAFPNPAQNELNLVGSIITSESIIILQDILGQTLNVSSNADSNSIVLATNELSKGVYFITVILGEKNQVIRFIKE